MPDDPDALDGARTAKADEALRAPDPVVAYQLDVVEGPDTGKRFALDAAQPCRVLVGTSAACDLRLTDARVSRRHISLEMVGRRLRLRDLDSTNGTRVDGVASVEVLLSGGELLRIGGT